MCEAFPLRRQLGVMSTGGVRSCMNAKGLLTGVNMSMEFVAAQPVAARIGTRSHRKHHRRRPLVVYKVGPAVDEDSFDRGAGGAGRAQLTPANRGSVERDRTATPPHLISKGGQRASTTTVVKGTHLVPSQARSISLCQRRLCQLPAPYIAMAAAIAVMFVVDWCSRLAASSGVVRLRASGGDLLEAERQLARWDLWSLGLRADLISDMFVGASAGPSSGGMTRVRGGVSSSPCWGPPSSAPYGATFFGVLLPR